MLYIVRIEVSYHHEKSQLPIIYKSVGSNEFKTSVIFYAHFIINYNHIINCICRNGESCLLV